MSRSEQRKALAVSFARNLRAARMRAGLTQGELAERANVAVEVYGRLERGITLPRADTLHALAVVLACSADHLLGIADRRPDDSLRVAEPMPPEQDPQYNERRLAVDAVTTQLADAPPAFVWSLAKFLASWPRRGR